jgi:hypothetical protein
VSISLCVFKNLPLTKFNYKNSGYENSGHLFFHIPYFSPQTIIVLASEIPNTLLFFLIFLLTFSLGHSASFYNISNFTWTLYIQKLNSEIIYGNFVPSTYSVNLFGQFIWSTYSKQIQKSSDYSHSDLLFSSK